MLRVICSSVLLSFVLCTQGYADEHFPFLAQVNKESVNVRAGANINFEVLAKLSRGAEVVVLGKNFDWYKVELPTTAKAYIRADYLKLHEDSFGELNGDKVNIRARANSDSSSLGQLNKGDYVKVIRQINDWWQIEPPAQAAGWIHKDFLSFKGPVGAITNRPYAKPSISLISAVLRGRSVYACGG